VPDALPPLPPPDLPAPSSPRLFGLLMALATVLWRGDTLPGAMPETTRSLGSAAAGMLLKRLTFGRTATDLDGLVDLLDAFDTLLVDGDETGAPLLDAEAALVWGLRASLALRVASGPGGSTALRILDRGSTARAARLRGEAAPRHIPRARPLPAAPASPAAPAAAPSSGIAAGGDAFLFGSKADPSPPAIEPPEPEGDDTGHPRAPAAEPTPAATGLTIGA
jgi:hypothetical protein